MRRLRVQVGCHQAGQQLDHALHLPGSRSIALQPYEGLAMVPQAGHKLESLHSYWGKEESVTVHPAGPPFTVMFEVLCRS